MIEIKDLITWGSILISVVGFIFQMRNKMNLVNEKLKSNRDIIEEKFKSRDEKMLALFTFKDLVSEGFDAVHKEISQVSVKLENITTTLSFLETAYPKRRQNDKEV